MRFDELGLKEAVLAAVTESGYENPTPIQVQAIPLILAGRDVIGASQTGTGKTAAFALPSLSKIEPIGKPQILVLEPTRELADQVAEQFIHYGKHTGCKVALLYGGVGHGKQDEELAAGADIVVATPGRLVDHFYRGSMKFKEIKILILDEVDRMLDMGFLPQVRKIISICPWNNEEQSRQTLFFSATMPPVIKGFAEWCLTNPETVEIARREVASTVSHAFFPVAMPQRDELLLALLDKTDYHSVMIFTRTRKEADVIAILLQEQREIGDQVTVMHSDIRQNDRMKALKGFKEGRYNILVATDVAARGIDISDVSHVINYRVPENAEDYVHRIGRTGRAEKEGDAFTLLTADELEYADSVEGFINRKIERKTLEGFDYKYTALLDTEPRKPIRKPKRGGGKRRRR
ncbi:MAG: DEAD/DEAH box helicase [Akkermansiaceae bacterium]|jgi:ATP-dependent RNA helicase RhlE